MTSARQAVAKRQAPQTQIEQTIASTSGMVDLVQRLMPTIADALPAAFTPERMAGIVSNAIRRSEIAKATGVSTWSLHDCTPESFVGSVLAAVSKGLEPGTEQAWLIPYENKKASRNAGRPIVECQLQIGYQGYVELFWRHPDAEYLETGWACENDVYEVTSGTSAELKHIKARGERGQIIAYYAVAMLKGRARPMFVDLTPDEVKALRGKEGPNGGIRDPQHWYERKTALKQLMKLLPKSPMAAAVIEADEQSGTKVWAEQIAPAARTQGIQVDQGWPPAAPALPQQQARPAAEVIDPATGEVPMDDAYDDEEWLGQEADR